MTKIEAWWNDTLAWVQWKSNKHCFYAVSLPRRGFWVHADMYGRASLEYAPFKQDEIEVLEVITEAGQNPHHNVAGGYVHISPITSKS